MSEEEKVFQSREELGLFFKSAMTVGKALRAYRTRNDLNQNKMAILLGISQNYFSDLENGRRVVSPETAAKYAEKMDEPVEYFMQLAIENLIRRAGYNFGVHLSPNTA